MNFFSVVYELPDFNLHNVLPLGEVADLEAQMFSFAQS